MKAALILVLGMTTVMLSGIDPNDTRLMEQPAISQDHIAFIYANDLWVTKLDGSQPRRLTVDEGIESRPHFRPMESTLHSAQNMMAIQMYTCSR